MTRALRIAAAVAVAIGLAATATAQSPHVDYMLECQGCHLADGSGKPGSVPSLRGHVARFLEVPGGRAFLVQVPGSALAPLGDAALAGVLNWLLAEFGPAEIAAAHPPYESEEVGRLRATPLTDVEATRAQLIEAMERDG